MTDFLHGVEVLELDSGARPIRTVRSGVIGLVGTAPAAEAASKAGLAVGTEADDNGLLFEAVAAGAAGNGLSIRFVDPAAAESALAISYDADTRAVTVSLETDAGSDVVSTGAEIIIAWALVSGLAAIVTIDDLGDSDGSGVVQPFNTRFLSGGQDEPFPLDTPVLIAGDRRQAAKLGATGTLPAAMADIFDQTGAVVVLVRVAEGENESGTRTNVIGGVNSTTSAYEGCQAFLGAESALGVAPRILIAPGFTENLSVAQAMLAVANRIRAHVIVDGPGTTDAAAIAYRNKFGSRRAFVVDPGFKAERAGSTVSRPASGFVAGLIAASDSAHGFWRSPSNQEIFGVVGTVRPVDFTLGDPNSRANLLNEQEVATVINKNGFRLWGNRTCSQDPVYAFLSVSRTADIIDDSILRAHMWAVDRGITRQYFEAVADGVNAYLRTLQSLGAIIGGRCWADEELNTPENIADGKVYFNFDFGPVYPAERVVFRRRINNGYLEEIV